MLYADDSWPGLARSTDGTWDSGLGVDSFSMRSCLYRKPGRHTAGRVALAVEELLEIRVNGVPQAAIMRTPGQEAELAVGFCLSEGIVRSPAELGSVDFCTEDGETNRNAINVVKQNPPCGAASVSIERELSDPWDAAAPNSAGGLSNRKLLDGLLKQVHPLRPGPQFTVRGLLDLHRRLQQWKSLYHLTRGTHAVALAQSNGELLVLREDIGRHNALDKVIGYALFHGIDLADTVLMLSGRISFEMVQKAVRARVPLLAADSAATSLAVELADRLNCTLVGGLREGDAVVYTQPARVQE